MLNHEVYSAILAGASKVTSTVKVQVGWKPTNTGRESPVYASFRLPVSVSTFEDVLAALRAMHGKQVNVSLPRTQSGERISVVISLRTVYAAETLADVLQKLNADESPTPRKSRKPAATNGTPSATEPAPAPAA